MGQKSSKKRSDVNDNESHKSNFSSNSSVKAQSFLIDAYERKQGNLAAPSSYSSLNSSKRGSTTLLSPNYNSSFRDPEHAISLRHQDHILGLRHQMSVP